MSFDLLTRGSNRPYDHEPTVKCCGCGPGLMVILAQRFQRNQKWQRGQGEDRGFFFSRGGECVTSHY